MSRGYASYALDVPVSYHLTKADHSQDLVIFLHGFRESAITMAERSLGGEGLPCSVLVPNGPFPTPLRDKATKRYEEAYSWYFLNPDREGLQVPPGPAVSYLSRLVEDLGFADHRKILVGFSQGAFLAPLLAPALTGVARIISLGGGFRVKDYEKSGVTAIDAIHGDADAVVPLAEARRSYDDIAPLRKEGRFVTVPGLGHDLNDEGRGHLRRMLREGFAW